MMCDNIGITFCGKNDKVGNGPSCQNVFRSEKLVCKFNLKMFALQGM